MSRLTIGVVEGASAQLLTGVSVSSTTGREMRLDDNDQYRGLNRADIIQRFIESKSSPVASFVLAMIRGKNMIGEKFDLGKETLARVIPMTIQDSYEAVEEWGAVGALAAIPAGVGLGLQTYARPGDRLHFGQPVITFKTSKGKTDRGLIPRDSARAYLDEMQGAEAKALERLAGSPGFMALSPDRQDARLRKVVDAYRQQVRARWIRRNGALLAKAAATGKSVTLVPPVEKAFFGLDPNEVSAVAKALRPVYPEFAAMTDEEVIAEHHKLYAPEMSSQDYATRPAGARSARDHRGRVSTSRGKTQPSHPSAVHVKVANEPIPTRGEKCRWTSAGGRIPSHAHD